MGNHVWSVLQIFAPYIFPSDFFVLLLSAFQVFSKFSKSCTEVFFKFSILRESFSLFFRYFFLFVCLLLEVWYGDCWVEIWITKRIFNNILIHKFPSFRTLPGPIYPRALRLYVKLEFCNSSFFFLNFRRILICFFFYFSINLDAIWAVRRRHLECKHLDHPDLRRNHKYPIEERRAVQRL